MAARSAGRSHGAGLYLRALATTRQGQVSIATLGAIALWGGLRLTVGDAWWTDLPLMVMSAIVGVPLAVDVVRGVIGRRIGADVLGLLAIVTAGVMSEWLVAAVIALMVSGGRALEDAASARASEVLAALARRSPTIAHLRAQDGSLTDQEATSVRVGDVVVVLPHEICPVDGVVREGHGAMDESYLTGEPYVVPKTPGSEVLSGAINSTEALVIEARRAAQDSRYAQIVGVLEKAEAEQPPMRRLADRLGLTYTVIALGLATAGWVVSGDPNRFLAVLVIATPCPLLIGVPVAIIGAIALAARYGIIVKDPSMLERISTARTMIFDKTGTLTYGKPTLTSVHLVPGIDRDRLLALAGSAERYSRHPLAVAVVEATEDIAVLPVTEVTEIPGAGLRACVDGALLLITGRAGLARSRPELLELLPPEAAGLECVVLVDDRYAATLQFRDEPRVGAREFIGHLGHRHDVVRTMLLSGDRSSEVEYLAGRVGLSEARAQVSPEEKLDIVRRETEAAPTVFLGDGINDAPAMTAATVGVAFGKNNDVTAEAADAVVLDSSFERLDELLHIGRRMRRIALQTAIGGIALSAIGMVLAVVGLLPPLLGAVAQEVIDVLAIVNAARVSMARKPMADLPAPGVPVVS
ncbi:MAG: heavy metal translocating P-type ATPase [Actinomycetales bacterium]|nr:heavy metal translocating P-type ATPase [Actinomycetales bacterium]